MDPTMTYRTYLTMKVLERQDRVAWTVVEYVTATEAVASTAIEHPEWPLDERRTYQEWERYQE